MMSYVTLMMLMLNPSSTFCIGILGAVTRAPNMQPEITRIDPHNINNLIKSIVKTWMVMTFCINSTLKLTRDPTQPNPLGALISTVISRKSYGP